MPSTESVSHDELIVCTCENREYKARDAIDAALFRGELDDAWRSFLTKTAAVKQADETDMEFDEDALDVAAETFRYQHDLITAEETEQWLAIRGLTVDDFSDYFTRQYCGDCLGEEITVDAIDYVSAPPELRTLFTAELILSGELDRMTVQLIWRLAARIALKDCAKEATAAEEQRFFERNQMDPTQLSGWLARLGRDAGWFGEMTAMEAAYRGRCDTLLLPKARQNELVTLRLPLTCFETEVVELESRDAAQEALFCVREDGMSMEEVATEGRYPYRQVAFLLEDLPLELQPKFLSVSAGDVIEPMPRGDGFELVRITKKAEPQADDPAVQQRIERRLIERHFSDLASKCVQQRFGAAPSTE